MTTDQPLSLELEQAVDHALAGVRFSALRSAVSGLSDSYREPRAGPRRGSSLPDDLAVLAYVATRMPATLAVARAVLRELRARCPALKVERLLDLGSGPGTTLWAAGFEIPELVHATLVEPGAATATMARRLLHESSLDRRVATTWYPRAIDVPRTDDAHDLVVVGYLLTELDDTSRRALLNLAWEQCRGAVIVIVPGSTEGYQAMLDSRTQLLGLGANLVAPCPHAETCPLPEDDWCHFGVRLNRSSLHRRLKGGSLPYEDEKYGYLVATRGAGHPASARVLRRPWKHHRRVTLRLCGADGVRDEVVTRTNRVAYRHARKVKWGEDWAED